MKARGRMVVLVLSISFCAVTCNDRDVDTADKRPKAPTLSKYYEPYESDIKPNCPGYNLPLDLNDIVNISKTKRVIEFDSISYLIRQNGFAIMELKTYSLLGRIASFDFVSNYKFFGENSILPFVTSDTGLYLYHVLFDETLKDIEERQFLPDINELTNALLDDALEQYEQLNGDLKEAANRNVTYLAVAQRLIDPTAPIPELVDDIVVNELAKIEAHSGYNQSDIFIYKEDYSQYVPRGHYTQSGALKRYFKTMMWYGRMAFLLKGSESWGPTGETLVSVRDARIQTLQAFLLATSLKNVQIGERTGLDICNRVYTVTSFYVDLADDLTP